MKLHKSILNLSSKFDKFTTFFVDHLDGKLSLFQNLLRLSQSYAGAQFNWQSPSLDWKSLFKKQHKSIFFVDHLDGKLALFYNLIGLSHSLVDPHFIWQSPSLDWISLFVKLHKSISIFERKIWQNRSFFHRPPRWKIISVSEPTRNVTLFRSPSFQLKKPFTRLKIAFQETAQEYFLSSKFDNVLSTFFVDHLDGKLALFHNLIGLSHSLVDPHFIWKSPSLDWISLFVKLHKSISIFERKIWQNRCFFRRPPRWKIVSNSEPTRNVTILRRPSFQLKKLFTRLKIVFKKLPKSIFWARNLTTC